MGKKNDLDLQTFVIYQDEETSGPSQEDSAQKKKKFSIPSFKKKQKVENAVDSDSDSDDHPSDSIYINNGTDKQTIIKGLAMGIGILMLIILIDQFAH